MNVSASAAFLSLSLPACLSQNRLDKYPPACQHQGIGAAENRFNPCLRLFLVQFRFVIVFKLIWLSCEISKVPFPTASAKCMVTPQNSCRCPGTHSSHWLWGHVACSDCRTGMSCSLCACLMKYFRCLSIYLCHHTGLRPRNLCAYQPAEVDWSLLMASIILLFKRCPPLGGLCLCSV